MKQLFFSLLLTIITLSCKQDSKDKSIALKIDSNTSYSHDIIAGDLDIPWGFTFLPDGSMLINEKEGELILFKNGRKTIINGLPEIKVQGQGGLMDIELHPNYSENGWIYISYATEEGEGNGANTAIMRFQLEGNNLINKEMLYKANPNSKRGQHFGSRIVFDNEGYLYFTIGDRGNRDVNPQNIKRDGGKVYRLHDNGKIPVSNPFVKERDAKMAIFSYGHRNPQGMEKHPITGEIWTHEHGPKGGDEINIVASGKNYGWPKASFGVNYSGTSFTDKTSIPGMVDPIHHWTPSIAPSGMVFVTSNLYPELKGNLLVGSLKFQYVSHCVLDGSKVVREEKILEDLGRVRSIEQGPDNYIYVGIENVGIVRLNPKK
jgi:glucose/arabinose dehydrogenase